MFLIFGGIFGVEETHKRTVGYKWYNAVGLVMKILQSADPNENNEDGYADKFQSATFHTGCYCEQSDKFLFHAISFYGFNFLMQRSGFSHRREIAISPDELSILPFYRISVLHRAFSGHVFEETAERGLVLKSQNISNLFRTFVTV